MKKWHWYPICMLMLIIYVVLVAYFFIFPHLALVQKDSRLILLIALLLMIPSYIAIMIAQYKLDCKRRDLTHVIFLISVGLVISLLITVEEEWVAFPSVVSSTSFKNMSVSVERISPFTIPLNSFIHPSNYSNIPVTVTIYNYTSIEPVSVSMSTSSNTIFDYDGFQNKSNGYDPRTKSFVYFTGISARHTGQVFNSTNEYVINIGYRNISVPQNNTITAKNFSTISSATTNSISNLTMVNITDIPDNRIYQNPVPFQWTVRMTDLSLTTYFWIIMAGVVTSRFMSLILDKTEAHRRHGDDDKDFQIIGWKDGLGILFSFIIALILFSSFKEQLSSLTTMVLFNISIAFAFGFAFDKTLEVVPRFSSRYRADLPTANANGINTREDGGGTKTGGEDGGGTKTGGEDGGGTKTGGRRRRTGGAKS